MTAPRLPEVVARVVAWHNRHPLARRIDASQVHSIGEVRLPFASNRPWGDAAAVLPAATPPAPPPGGSAPDTPATPTLAEALAQRQARQAATLPPSTAPGIEGLDVASVLPDAAPDADPAAAAADDRRAAPPAGADGPTPQATDAGADPGDDDGEAALVIPLLDGDAAAEPAPAPAGADDPSDDRPADQAEGAPEAGPLPTDQAADPAADPWANTADTAEPTSAPAMAEAPADAAVDAAPAPTAAGAEPAPPEVYPPPHGNVAASALARAVERRAAARGGAVAADAAPAAPDTAAAAWMPPPAGSRWQRLVDRLRQLVTGRQPGLPPLRAVFRADFAWPLRPGQVARWAQRHGRPAPLAPLDWPRRSIDVDPGRLARHRAKGFGHDLPLHVLTAAIGVGDRRIRVLIGADGRVLGPRAFDRSRSGAVATLAGIGLVALGWTLHPPPPAEPAALLAAAPAAPAEPAASAASAADLPASAASAASAPDDAASAGATDAATLASTAASAPEAAASEPAGDIRPVLSDAEKYAARVEAAQLRGEPPPPPPEPAGPVYAVVGPGSASPDAARRSLALMQATAAKLDGGAPAHGELVNSQGQWRAAWWPFTSLVDAERARVLLAGRGLKAEVVEF